MPIKKFFAILCVVFMLSSLCGCTNPQNTKNPIGSLQVAVDYVFEVKYNNDGLVTALTGLNNPSTVLADGYAAALDTPCETVVTTLVKTIVESGDCQNAEVIVLKQTPDSKVPSATFLEKIRKDAEAVSGGRPVLLITADRLTKNGQISASTATDILTQHLSLSGAKITCAEKPEGGKYALSVIYQDTQTTYYVNADTGVVIPFQ